VPGLRATLQDPFATGSLRLTLAALECLADLELLAIAPFSPLSFLLGEARRTLPEEREAARPDVVHALCFGSRTRHALEILARPDARVRIADLSPSAPPAVRVFHLAGEWAAAGQFEAGAFSVGPPVAVGALAHAIFHRLRDDPPQHGSALLWPSQIEFAGLIWSQGSVRACEPVPLSAARMAFAKWNCTPEQGEQALTWLEQTQFIERASDSVRLRPPNDYWLDLLWSGHSTELEYLRLLSDRVPTEEELNSIAEEAVFVGPPGRRVLRDVLRGEEIAAEFGEDSAAYDPPEDQLVALTYMPADELYTTLLEFLSPARV